MLIDKATVGSMKKASALRCIILIVLTIITTFILVGCSVKHEHTYTSQWSVDDDYHWHSDTCDHDTKSDKALHSFGSWEVIKNATVSESGLKIKVCTVCNYSEEEEIAKVIPSIYEIKYNLGGGTFLTSVDTTYTYGTGIDCLPTEKDLTREGYIFAGWKDSKNNTVTNISSTVEGNVELVAQWTLIEYTATFMADGEIVGTSKFTIEDFKINNVPAIPEKVGYASEWENYALVADDISVNAVYNKISYTITYSNTKGVVQSNKTSYTIEDETFALSNLDKDGYIFDGWYDDNEKVESITKGSYGDRTLTAKWTPIEYTATFKADGEIIGTVEFTVEDSHLGNVPAVPEKVGYTSAWEMYQIGTSDITINAVYALVTYKATFKVEDRALRTVPFTVQDVQINNVPTIPEKTGYTSEWEEYTLIAKDIVINAVYVPITYAIQYLNIKEVENSNVNEFNIETETFALYDLPNTNGYCFVGWYNGINHVIKIDKGTVGNIVLTAKWELENYSINYYLNNGINNDKNPNSYSIESDTIQLLSPNKKGYNFIGWFTDSECLEQNYITEICIGSYGNLNLYAKWSPIVYTIVFNKNSDVAINSMNPQKVIYDTTTNLTENLFLNPGYTFVGWTENADGTGKKYDDAAVISNLSAEHDFEIDLFAQWKIIVYSIVYVFNGGSGENPSTYTVETNIVLSNPVKNGYDFLGWTGSNGETPEIVVEIEKGCTGNLSFVANWDLCTYDISYELSGGINAIKNPDCYTIIDTIELHAAKKEYYTFDGWFTDSDFTNEITSLYGLYGDLTLYAKFIPYSYVATFDAGDGELVYRVNLFYWENSEDNTTLEFKNGEVFNPYFLVSPDRTDYIFYAWYYDSDLTMLVDDDISVYSHLNLYAKWIYKPIGYVQSAVELRGSIAVNPYYTGSYSSSEYAYFYVPYNYCGSIKLSCEIRGPESWISGKLKMGSGSVSLHDLTSNTTIFSKSSTNGSASDSKNIDLVEGHYYRITGSLGGSGFTPGTGYARLSVMPTKTFKTTCLSFENEVIQHYGTMTITPPANRLGYDFTGWYDSDNNLITEVWNYTSEQTFHAGWKLHNYAINYYLSEGANNEANPLYYNLESANVVLESPTKTGYTFVGWYTDSEFINQISAIDINDCKDYYLYAKWIANTYTVTLDYNGGQNCPTIRFYSEGFLIKSQDLYKDSTLNYFVPTNSNINYAFGGWYIDEMCTELYAFSGVVAADLNLYAKWVDISDVPYCGLGEKTTVTINGNTYQYIAIVLPTNQTVTISSQSVWDLYGEVYNSQFESIAYCDDISDENLDFSITVNLNAGQIYYVGYRANQASVQGECYISITGTNEPSIYITGDYTDVIETISVVFDNSYSLPIPKKEGYTFIGWYDNEGNLVDESMWNYETNMILFAHWEMIEVTMQSA